jgi:hypothetical protein
MNKRLPIRIHYSPAHQGWICSLGGAPLDKAGKIARVSRAIQVYDADTAAADAAKIFRSKRAEAAGAVQELTAAGRAES